MGRLFISSNEKKNMSKNKSIKSNFKKINKVIENNYFKFKQRYKNLNNKIKSTKENLYGYGAGQMTPSFAYHLKKQFIIFKFYIR